MSLAAVFALLAASPIGVSAGVTPAAAPGEGLTASRVRVSAVASVEILRVGRAGEGNTSQSLYRATSRRGSVTMIDFE